MSSLAFLTPRGPAPESPLAAAARRDGATLDIRDGWLVPVRFTSLADETAALTTTVGWGDASAISKFELRAPTDLPPGTARHDDGGWWCPVTPSLMLVIGATSVPTGRILDVTTQHGAVAIAGPLARETIARFCALDLRDATPGSFRPGSVARTPGSVLCVAPDRFLLLFGAAVSDYMWTVVGDAGRSLGGHPVGYDAFAAGRSAASPAARTEAARA